MEDQEIKLEEPVTRRRVKATMVDVAELAQVSPATVSRVMNEDLRVKTDTRAKVLLAVESLKYQVDERARALTRFRKKKSDPRFTPELEEV